jgi:signal transduction histidine kinase/AraC-like DNA-binding protein
MDKLQSENPEKSPRQVLFIDDELDFETLIRQRFRKAVRQGEIELFFAYNGAEGLDILRKHPGIGIVFTDINMPEMDGITFLRELENSEWKDRLLRVVVVTAFGNMKNIRHAMNNGAFDFINKPVEFDDLKATLQKAASELNKMEEGREASQLLESAIREKELALASEKLKEDFFSNITHELRTPLTLIMGPVEQLLENPRDPSATKKLNTVRNNGRRLLRLINRLLDLSRVEAGSMRLNLRRVDLAALLREVVTTFSDLARRKQIQLLLQRCPEQFYCDLDPEKFMQVLYNLISNAIKFTPKGGRVLLELVENEDATFTVSVKDSGIGIPQEGVAHVFDRFFRVEGRPGKGTGIGLSLSKELVELHGGQMSVRSIEGLGSEFFFQLPRRENVTESFDPIAIGSKEWETDTNESDSYRIALPEERDLNIGVEVEEDDEEDLHSEGEGLPVVLIVEDNLEMQDLIASELESLYTIYRAGNGKTGLETAIDLVPDLVVCDVMMPEMDGYEFCKKLKGDDATSHIPVIMLTARAAIEDKLQGLELGADDYLTKPFESRELRARVLNLVEGRQKMRDYFRNQFLTSPGEIQARSREEVFLLKLKSVIQDHLADELFGVEALCQELGMSRTQVHRKLSALTGNSAGYFIRTYRLETAMEMLRKDTGNISEIAYDVGFSSPSYFTKCFTEHFSMTPRQVRKSLNN